MRQCAKEIEREKRKRKSRERERGIDNKCVMRQGEEETERDIE